MTPFQQLGAAVVGTGFIGVVHVEALRRLGVEVTGVVGSSPERAREKARDRRAARAVRELRGDARRRARRRRPHHVAQQRCTTPQARAALAAGKHVVCEKPLAMTAAETAELLALAERERARARGQLQHPLLPAVPARRASAIARGRARRRAPRHRRLPAGLAAARHRLELAPGPGRGRRAARGRRHRLALARPAAVRHRPPRRGRDGRPRDVRARAPASRSARSRRSPAAAGGRDASTREMETEDAAGILLRFEGGARGVCTVSQVSRRAQEPPARSRSTAAQASLAWNSERPEELWIGHRDAPERAAAARPGADRPRRGAAHALPGGHAEGFADTFRELYRGRLPRRRRGRAAGRARLPDVRRRPRRGADRATRSRASAREGRWVDRRPHADRQEATA